VTRVTGELRGLVVTRRQRRRRRRLLELEVGDMSWLGDDGDY